MLRIKVRTGVLFFLFFYCSYVMGETSTSIAPSIPSAPVPTPVPSSLQPLSPYTQVASIPSNPATFVSNSANVCQSNEKRDSCFVRYTVRGLTNVAAGSPQYMLVNSNLQCPAGYYGVAAFDNRVIDTTNSSDTIYYFSDTKFYPVSQSDYDTYSNSGFLCTAFASSPVVDSGSQCIDGGCGSIGPQYKVVNGYMVQKVTSSLFRQDTYNGGGNKCQHYTLSGCPSWCSRWQWERYQYKNVQCTRSAGFYKAVGTLPSALLPAINPLYTPSVIICSKPSIGWH